METYPQPGAETQGFGPPVTSPTYGPPLQAPDADHEAAKRKRTTTLIIGLIAFLVLAMVGLGIGLTLLSKNRSARSGPQTTVTAGGPIAKGDLIYPGATVNFHVKGDEGERVLQLRTDDSVEDVVAWYEKKMGTVKKVYMPVGTTMTDGDTAVVITGIGDGTQILLTQK